MSYQEVLADLRARAAKLQAAIDVLVELAPPMWRCKHPNCSAVVFESKRADHLAEHDVYDTSACSLAIWFEVPKDVPDTEEAPE